MAKRQKFEETMLTEVSKRIENNNKTIDELINRIMQEVEDWVKVHKKDWNELSVEDQSTLTQPTHLVRKVAEIKYSRNSLRNSILNNLKRATGNLCEEERMLGLYATLAKFNYSCPYSGTLLIGGEQKIHIDHIIPVTMGGPTDDWNCIPVCENCNESKRDRHLLDWWQENRTKQEEYKLLKIFEHMTSKLLDETNKIHYLETEDKTKHLDVVTFLNQLYEHIQENKEYIFEYGFESEKEKIKEIEKKLKELKSTLEKVIKKNNKNTKTDKQHFAEMREMVKFVKSMGVRSYYKIAYTYFDEIQKMRNLGKPEEEIRTFCFHRDDSFNFTLFYEKLIDYKEKHGSFDGITKDKEIGNIVQHVRQAKKGKGKTKITSEMIEKLNAIGFDWGKDNEEIIGQWFLLFYEKLIAYKNEYGSFTGVIMDKEIGNTVNGVRQAKKGKGKTKLTQEMIAKLDAIGFPWEVEKVDWFTPFYEKLIKYKEKKGSFEGVTRDKEIGMTVSRVRQAKKGKGATILTPEMIEKLDAIGFVWEVEKVDWFTPFYEKLIEYKEKHGSFYGVVQDKEIGGTVASVRQAKKGKGETNLTQEIIEKLDTIGFDWGKNKEEIVGVWFDEFYEQLIAYKQKHGSFSGVTKDKRIGNTVDSIRQAKKGKGNTKLTQEMIEKLNAIGFDWGKKVGEWFDEFYEKLIDYKEKHGSFDGVTKDKEIGLIVGRVRKSYKGKGGTKLTQEMINKLNKIGFPWEARPKKEKEDNLSV